MTKIWPHLEKKQKRAAPEAPRPRFMSGTRIRLVSTFGGFLLALSLALSVIYRDRSGEVSGSSAVTECDHLAAHPADTQKRAPGVPQADVDLPKAIFACEAALAARPGDGRTLYQLGRVQYYAQQYPEGIGHLRQAADAGYAQSQFVLGVLLTRGTNITADACEGGRLWAAAARQNHFHSKTYLARGWLDGTFKDCTLDVTPEDITALLDAASAFAETPAQKDELAQVKDAWEKR